MSISKVLFALLIALALSISSVFAGSVSLTIGEEARLSSCGGYVQITKSAQGNNGEQVNLVFRGVQSCSNFDILSNAGSPIGYPNKKLQGKDGQRGGSFTLPKNVLDYGWNNVKVVVNSNGGAHSDTINVRVIQVPAPAPIPVPRGPVYRDLSLTIGDSARLPSCGGYIQVTRSPQGNNGEQVNLVFRNVESCSNFDILSSNYQEIGYPNKKLQGGQGNYNGSFTLPKSVIDYGFNNIRIVVNSNSKAHADRVSVLFVGTPSGSKDPLPSAPSSGGAW